MFKSILAIVVMAISVNSSAAVFTNGLTGEQTQADLINNQSTIIVNGQQFPVTSKAVETIGGDTIVSFVNDENHVVIDVNISNNQYRTILFNGNGALANGYTGN